MRERMSMTTEEARQELNAIEEEWIQSAIAAGFTRQQAEFLRKSITSSTSRFGLF